MKIIKQTCDQLILEKKIGWCFSLIIVGSFFGAIPLFMLIELISNLGVTNINCQRVEPTQVNCKINRSGFGGLIEKEKKIFNHVTDVKFEQTEGEDSEGGSTIDNKVILANKSGENFIIQDYISVNGVSGDAAKMAQIESQMSNFLHSNQSSFLLNVDNRWRWSNLFVFGFISIFIIIGGGLVFGSIFDKGYEKIVFDKLTQQFQFEKVNLLGKKNETHNLSEITSIIIQEYTDSDGDKSYSLILLIVNNKTYILDSSLRVNMFQETANKIADFLQITIINTVK